MLRPEIPEQITDAWLARCALYNIHQFREGAIGFADLQFALEVIAHHIKSAPAVIAARLKELNFSLEMSVAIALSEDEAGHHPPSRHLSGVESLLNEYVRAVTPLAGEANDQQGSDKVPFDPGHKSPQAVLSDPPQHHAALMQLDDDNASW
ncbi:MAG: hypothetical protein AAGJ94_11310 [Pseudomonadota bacterium]